MKLIIPFFISLLVFAIYFLGISSSVFGGDSGDIILASWFGGVAHPPGYPLNTMLGYLFTHIPFEATVAYKSNLMMAFLQAVNIGILYLILVLLVKKRIIAIAAALVVAFNPLFWLYAHVTEVFQLKITLVGLAIYFLLLWRFKVIEISLKKRAKSNRYFYLSIVFLGLSIFHHHISLLLIPAFYYLIRKTDKSLLTGLKNVTKLAVGLLIGLIPYLFIVFAAYKKTPVNWDNPSNLDGFLRLITRADFGTFTATDFLVGQTVQDRLIQLKTLFAFSINDFTYLGLILAILGFIYLFYSHKSLFWFVFYIIFFIGPFFLVYSSFPLKNDFLLGIWERFILEFYFFLAIPLAYGFLAIFELINKRINDFSLKHKKIILILIQVSFLLFPSTLYFANVSKSDFSNFQLGNDLGHDVLVSSTPDSIVFVLDDTIAFASQYSYYTSSQFRDRKLIIGGFLKFPYYRQEILERYPGLYYSNQYRSSELIDSAVVINELIEKNRQQFDIFTTGFNFRVENAKWVPSGLLVKLRYLDEPYRGVDNGFSRFMFAGDRGQYKHFTSNYMLSVYRNSYIRVANYYSANSDVAESIDYYEKARILFPNEVMSYTDYIHTLIIDSRCNEAKKLLEVSIRVNNFGSNVGLMQNLVDFERACNKNEDAALKIESEIQKTYERDII